MILALAGLTAQAEEQTPWALRDVGLEQKLGDRVDLDLRFTDSQGAPVTFRDLVADGKPIVLTMNWYRCRTLCSTQLNALLDVLKGFEWAPGDQYRLVTVGIDPDEGVDIARAKRDTYVSALGRGEVDWRFLVGEPDQVDALAQAIGFKYRWDEDSQQWAHPAALVIISPEGVITRYLSGVGYTDRDLRLSLVEAGEGKVGTVLDFLVLRCFSYDEEGGRYTAEAFTLMRGGAALTIGALALFGLVSSRREPSSASPGSA